MEERFQKTRKQFKSERIIWSSQHWCTVLTARERQYHVTRGHYTEVMANMANILRTGFNKYLNVYMWHIYYIYIVTSSQDGHGSVCSHSLPVCSFGHGRPRLLPIKFRRWWRRWNCRNNTGKSEFRSYLKSACISFGEHRRRGVIDGGERVKVIVVGGTDGGRRGRGWRGYARF